MDELWIHQLHTRRSLWFASERCSHIKTVKTGRRKRRQKRRKRKRRRGQERRKRIRRRKTAGYGDTYFFPQLCKTEAGGSPGIEY